MRLRRARAARTACALLAATMFASLDAREEAEAHSPEPSEVLQPIVVTAERIANWLPAGGAPTLATALRFDAAIDLQSRGAPEAQADVTVRGGLFENTAFRLGAVTVFDPQTGHHAVAIPIDPDLLTAPVLQADAGHALRAFNATVASLNYGFGPVRAGGAAMAGVGSDALYLGSARLGFDTGDTTAVALSAAASRGDGTLPYGDHDFRRFTVKASQVGAGAETHALFGYLDTFTGWPGMYTGFASLPETDHLKSGLALFDHRRDTTAGWIELAFYYRWLEDDYDFDRRTVETGVPGSFEHETRNYGLGIEARQRWLGLEWHAAAQVSADRLVRSTDLRFGRFDSRSYLALALAPHWTRELGDRLALSLSAGIRADFSNRDEDAWLPLARVALEHRGEGSTTELWLDYSESSQVPGYTALNSPPLGLFGGNADLGREYARNLTLALSRETGGWTLDGALFKRSDRDLVDWTFRRGAPFVRQANPVDVDVRGLEVNAHWNGARLDLRLGYAWLHKDADYGTAPVDASYYALNFARHRATLSMAWRPLERLEFRLDNEFRVQEDNPLRSSRDRAYLGALSANWRPRGIDGLRLSLIVDNLSDSDFQDFPGTPASGRQWLLNAGYGW